MTEFKSEARTFFRGFVRMVYGTCVFGLIRLAIQGYAMIPNERGFSAVWYFALTSCVLAMGLFGTYLMGGTRKKGAK